MRLKALLVALPLFGTMPATMPVLKDRPGALATKGGRLTPERLASARVLQIHALRGRVYTFVLADSRLYTPNGDPITEDERLIGQIISESEYDSILAPRIAIAKKHWHMLGLPDPDDRNFVMPAKWAIARTLRLAETPRRSAGTATSQPTPGIRSLLGEVMPNVISSCEPDGMSCCEGDWEQYDYDYELRDEWHLMWLAAMEDEIGRCNYYGATSFQCSNARASTDDIHGQWEASKETLDLDWDQLWADMCLG